MSEYILYDQPSTIQQHLRDYDINFHLLHTYITYIMDMELGRMIEERTNVRIHISTSPVQNYSRYQIYYSKHYILQYPRNMI